MRTRKRWWWWRRRREREGLKEEYEGRGLQGGSGGLQGDADSPAGVLGLSARERERRARSAEYNDETAERVIALA